MTLTRRQASLVLSVGAMGASTASCATGRVALPDRDPDLSVVSDVHAHLFNASDLPIEGFVRYVVAKNPQGVGGAAVRALAQTLRFVSRRLSISAVSERRQLRPFVSQTAEVTEDRYAEQFGRYVEAGLEGRASALDEKTARPDSESLVSAQDVEREGFRELALLVVGEVAPRKAADPALAPFARRGETFEGAETEALVGALKESVAAAARRDDEIEALYGEKSLPGLREEKGLFAELTPADVVQTIAWGFGLLRSRRRHLATYLQRMKSGQSEPTRLVNLLIDYDQWLEDRPAKGSHQLAQLDFWRAYSQRVSDRADIVTFAGFDPLKAAEQRRSGREPRLIDEMFARQKAIDSEGFTGFKLYPPMGFRPFFNASIEASNGVGPFAGSNGIRTLVEDRWKRDFDGSEDIGAALDAELHEFYQICVSRNIPILAHAGQSVYSAREFRTRMSPEHWSRLILEQGAGLELKDLRVCLGHFTHPQSFVDALQELPDGAEMGAENPYRGNSWAWRWTGPLLWHSRSTAGLNRRASVFADISYMEEFVAPDGAEQAASFFKALKTYCEIYDPDCEGLIFGTDWIMLGREPNFAQYLENVERGIEQAKWPEAWKDNFFRRNFDRFIK